jgi:hypothetical protein
MIWTLRFEKIIIAQCYWWRMEDCHLESEQIIWTYDTSMSKIWLLDEYCIFHIVYLKKWLKTFSIVKRYYIKCWFFSRTQVHIGKQYHRKCSAKGIKSGNTECRRVIIYQWRILRERENIERKRGLWCIRAEMEKRSYFEKQTTVIIVILSTELIKWNFIDQGFIRLCH